MAHSTPERRLRRTGISNDGAKRKLSEMGIDLRTFNIEKIRDDLAALESERKLAKASYSTLQRSGRELTQKRDNITEFLGKDEPQASKEERKKQRTTIIGK